MADSEGGRLDDRAWRREVALGGDRQEELAVLPPPPREDHALLRPHPELTPPLHRLVADEGHLHRAGVAPEPGAQHLEGALLGRPQQVGGPVAIVVGGGDQRLLGRRQVRDDEGVAPGLDQLQVATDPTVAVDERAHRPPRPVRHRHHVIDRRTPDVCLRSPVGRVAHLDRGQRAEVVRRHAQAAGEGLLGGPAPEEEVVAAFAVAHEREAFGLPRAEPRLRRGHLRLAPGQPVDLQPCLLCRPRPLQRSTTAGWSRASWRRGGQDAHEVDAPLGIDVGTFASGVRAARDGHSRGRK